MAAMHLAREARRSSLNVDDGEAAGYAREQMQWEREARRREFGDALGPLFEPATEGRW